MAAEIHPTAIVARGADVGAGCVIGPYCVVGERVRLGADTRLHSHVVVEGRTTLGAGCEVFPFACIGGMTQDLKYKGGETYVDVGEGTTLREYVTVHASTFDGGRTVIGRDCHILAYCHIAHDCRLGDRVIMSNATSLAGHVTVGDSAVFGGMVGVHQFVRIGTVAMVSATAKVVQDVLPFCLVEGNPAGAVTVNRVGLERNGRSPETIACVERAYRVLFRSNFTLARALEQLREELGHVEDVNRMIEFAQSSERGVARPRGQQGR